MLKLNQGHAVVVEGGSGGWGRKYFWGLGSKRVWGWDGKKIFYAVR